MNRNPEHMSDEEVVTEITSLQKEIKVKSLRAHELSSSLYRRVRRRPADDSTAIYMTYANSVTRFAGAIGQVLARTVRTAKILDRLPQRQPETPEPKREKPVQSPSPVESLINSYVNEAFVKPVVLPASSEAPVDEDA